MCEEIKFIRTCPSCGKEITYARKSDYNKAVKKGSVCKSCAVSKSSIFKTGHHFNDSVKRENSLNRLMTEQTPQSFYWIGFLIADGSFHSGGKFELGLAEKDLGVIEAFCEYIAYNNKIMYREDTKSYRISFANSIENPKFMEKYGFKPRKTYNPIDFFVFKDYDKELLLALLIGIIDGDGSIQPNGSSNAFCITITAHESWTQFYQEFMETLDIPEHISNREGSTTITIRICRREILQLLQDVITNNNLFHLKRKWNKLMIKEPSASES